MANKFSGRFAELIEEANNIDAKKRPEISPMTGSSELQIEREAFLAWKTKASHLISAACGPDSEHFKEFRKHADEKMVFSLLSVLKKTRAVLLAAQDDYDGGYLNGVRSLVQAEVFGSELEQAAEFLRLGYKLPAAVIAGTVLETHLRELCSRASIAHGTAARMNDDLVKSQTYNQIVAKRITALTAIRNSAAHGKPNDFTDDDVKSMIEEIERFLAQYP